MAKSLKCECQNCGVSFTAKKPARFHSTECRAEFHNRRKARGAELYDIVMAYRFERDRPDMFNLITRLASAYRDADKAKRAGRKSWDTDETLARIPLAYSTDGDGR